MNAEENLLKSTIIAAFPDLDQYIIGCIIETSKANKKTATIVFALKTDEQLNNKIKDFIKRFDQDFTNIDLVFEQKAMATKMAIIRSIKTLQPASIDDIKSYLIHQKFFFSEKLLKNDLDELRKASWVVWGDHSYRLTEGALRLLPHGNYRDSSDILRALEFNRKKW